MSLVRRTRQISSLHSTTRCSRFIPRTTTLNRLQGRHISTESASTTNASSPSTSTTTSQPIRKKSVIAQVGHATATGSYFLVVSAGVTLLGVVLWALGSNLFFETRYFSEAVDLIKANPELKKLLGNDINAYGERSPHRGRRGGGVLSQRTEDGHVFMVFHVEGSTGNYGTCRLDVQERNQNSEIRQLYCDIPGQPRIWLKQEKRSTLEKKKKLFSW